jgi:biopolymer transport protein ExbD
MSAGPLPGSSSSQEVDLNIAPIIDCFTVLIAFMLVSATYLSIQILDAGIAAGGAAPTDNVKPPSVSLTITLQADQSLQIEVTGKTRETLRAPAASGKWDYGAFNQQLAGLKAKWSDVSAATLQADPAIEYKDVVEAMQHTRKHFPYVMLGGF